MASPHARRHVDPSRRCSAGNKMAFGDTRPGSRSRRETKGEIAEGLATRLATCFGLVRVRGVRLMPKMIEVAQRS